MIGLEKEIESRKRRDLDYQGIADLLGITYPTARNKCKTGMFYVNEALAIMFSYFPTLHGDAFETFEYLFTDVKKEN